MHKARLTPRRLEMLKLMAKGYTNKEIVKIMDLSVTNFKLQKWRLYCYLGVHNSDDAIIVGKEMKLIH